MKKLMPLIFILTVFSNSCPTLGPDPYEASDSTLPSFVQTGGRTFYVSSEGLDSHDGMSQEQAWRTLSRVNQELFNLQGGDSVLFRRGDVFTGQLEPGAGTAENWIRYGAYGIGEKPILTHSVSLSQAEDWELVAAGLWKTSGGIPMDVGAVFIDNESLVGQRKWSLSELENEGDFYFDPTGSDTSLYLYSPSAPTSAYDQIEASLGDNIVNISQRSYLLLENFHLRKGAAHGIGGTDSEHIIIRNCDFSFLGGGFLYFNEGEPVRYGNGVEFWRESSNNLVENNRFWEIFDTALTNQGHERQSPGTFTQTNITYRNNIIWNCGLASFELWVNSEGSIMENITFEHNTSINPGQGWGGSAHRPDKNSFHIASFYNSSMGTNLVIRNNIFYSSETPPGVDGLSSFHAFFLDEDVEDGFSKYQIAHNLWEMPDPLWGLGIAGERAYSSLIDWQEATNQSLNAIQGNPSFVDLSTRNFSLQSQSPAINSGMEGNRDRDFFGNPILGPPDLGAIESF